MNHFDLKRRVFLRSAAGICLGLPLLDVSSAQAQNKGGFSLFVVNANGVAQRDGSRKGEVETWWPRELGTLTRENMLAQQGERTTAELADHAERLILVTGTRHPLSSQGCAHQSAENQLLSAATIQGRGHSSLANGETVDNRVARELNPEGREPLTLRASFQPHDGRGFDQPGFISYSGPGQPRAAEPSPARAYQRIVGVANEGAGATELQRLQLQRKSINDVLREQITELRGAQALSQADRQRLEQHFDNVRDVEVTIQNVFPAEGIERMRVVDAEPLAMSNHLEAIRLHMDLLVFAVNSGYTRAGSLKIGDRIDVHRWELDGERLPPFHQISHRIFGDGRNGDVIPDAYALHQKVDLAHVAEVKRMLDNLAAINTPTGPLIDEGYTVWTNQLATGWHGTRNLPWVVAGRAGGFFKSGQFIDAGNVPTNKLLSTFVSAAGVRTVGGDLVEDFGDAALSPGVMGEMIA